MTPKDVNEVIRTINWKVGTEEPPEKLLEISRGRARQIFKGIDYIINDNDEHEKIIEFIARYEISSLNTNQDKSVKDEHDYDGGLWPHAEKFGIVGKKFAKPKGLLLYGNYSTGKTTAARVISAMFDITMLTVESISRNFLAHNGETWLNEIVAENFRKSLIIDDIGNEDEMKKFGNDSPMRNFISSRAMSYEWFGVPTIYTTNIIDQEKLGQFYTDRIKSRILGTVQGVFVGGPDWRTKQR